MKTTEIKTNATPQWMLRAMSSMNYFFLRDIFGKHDEITFTGVRTTLQEEILTWLSVLPPLVELPSDIFEEMIEELGNGWYTYSSVEEADALVRSWMEEVAGESFPHAEEIYHELFTLVKESEEKGVERVLSDYLKKTSPLED